MNDSDIANSINWNDLLKHDARSIDGASIGQVQGSGLNFDTDQDCKLLC
jgi:hypothetical protein